MRKEWWADGAISPEEIFIINDRVRDSSPEWTEFFVEAIGECMVNRIDHDGQVGSRSDLKLLSKVFERAIGRTPVRKSP